MSWESSEGEERVSCRKQAETRTNQVIKQQQETIGKLQEDVQFLTQHYDPSVIPTDGFTVSARYRLIAEATEKEREGEWIFLQVCSENACWSKWVTGNALQSAVSDVELPEELTHALQMARVESASRKEDSSEQLTSLQNELEVYRKRTKTATLLLQGRCMEATEKAKTLETALEEAEKCVHTMENTLKESQLQNEEEIRLLDQQLKEKETMLAEKESALKSVQHDLEEARRQCDAEEMKRGEVEKELQAIQEKETVLREDVQVKDTAIQQLEKAVALWQTKAETAVQTTVSSPVEPKETVETPVQAQRVSEPLTSLQMPEAVRLSGEPNQDRRLESGFGEWE